MKKLNRVFYVFLAVLLYQCDDVLEEDISDDSIAIIAPDDGAAIEGNLVQLRWTALDGADGYRLQITSENNRAIVLDSLVDQTRFDYQVEPGNYTWRIRGENFAYNSPYTFESAFSVVASLDLTNQLLTLESPVEDRYTNEVDFNFTWQRISTADSYEFELLRVDGSGETSVFQESNLVAATIGLEDGIVTEDNAYIWQVKAVNATSETRFFRRRFFVDTQNPPAPTLNGPAADASFGTTDEVQFSWSFSDTGTVQSPISSTLEISTDENFSTILLSDTNDSDEFTNTFTTTGTYYWRVRGADTAGNNGDNSATGSFSVD